jgi:hypothetical protein
MPDLNKPIIDGKYDLYNYSTGDNIGTIKIIGENNTLTILQINADFIQGYDKILAKRYTFESIELDSLILEKEVTNKKEIYYFSDSYSRIILITTVYNDGYYKAIPDSIFSNKRDFYLFSIMNMNEFSFFKNATSSISIDKMILNNAYKSIYTGIFFYEKL